MPADSTSPSVPDLQRRVDELAAELRARTSDREEALRREAAIAEILQVTNASGGDLALVLNAIIEKATRLCSAFYGYIWTYDGESARAVAAHGDARFEEWLLQRDPVRPSEQSPLGRVLRSGRLAHVVDAKEDETYRNEPRFRDLVDRAGLRTLLHIPLRKGDTLLGVITVYRRERQAFTDQQIRLLESFAEQAVIAMENARLLDEQREALERQTAMAEVLQVINSSPGDLAPVFETILERATRLCEAAFGIMWRYDGDLISLGATHRVPQAFIDFASKPFRPAADSGPGRIMRGEGTFAVADMHEWEPYKAGGALPRAIGDLAGSRSFVIVPLRRGGVTLGSITLYRQEVRPFTPREISLVESFAAQAVIAMENARLLGELRESLEQQTATSDVLKTISRSSVNLEDVLETLVETAARLCRADQAYMFRRDDELYHLVAAHGLSDEAREFFQTHPVANDRGTITGRVTLERRTVHIADVLQDEEYTYSGGQRIAGYRTMLGIPLLREDTLIGILVVDRTRVEPFTDKAIALATGFADQAVIAIENARLFEELRDRQAELRVTFDNMGDGVAMFDAEPRLAAWNRNFEEIIGLPDVLLAERPSYADYLRLLAERGEFGTENVEAELASRLENTARELRLERTRADGTVIEVRRNAVPGGGFVLIYSDITERQRAEAEIRAARDAAESALERQTATADILKVIASSPTDVQPVLDAVVNAAVRFCGATDAMVQLRDGDSVVSRAHEGPLTYSGGARRLLDRSATGSRAIVDAQTCHHPDVETLDPVEFLGARRLAAQHGFRAIVAAPLRREDTAIGALSLRRVEPGPFTPQQIELLETFAAQAVIAIENVRLFTELKESLEQQTATADILRVISQSPTDVQPVLKAVVGAARRFCGADDAMVVLREETEQLLATHEGSMASLVGTRVPLDRSSVTGRAAIDGQTFHVPDVASLDPAEHAMTIELARKTGVRALLAAPMLREGHAIGCVLLRRPTPGAFTPRQIELLEAFAAQAVIAIQNVRLFTELKESLEQQTATAEILRAISQSPTDVQPVLDAVVKAAQRFCGAMDAVISLREDDEIIRAAHQGSLTSALGRSPLDRSSVSGRTIIDARTIHISDIGALDHDELATTQTLAAATGARAALAAPMLREGVAIGGILLRKREPGPFAPQQIELLETFAAQAVIAIENVRLFTELRDSLERLKAAQANLIQAEKMASLGQLTAGIAHEIKNPLNFVNNFAGLSVELLDELKQAAAPVLAGMNEEGRAEFGETVDLITANLEKIAEHGRRADGIVKSMLAHSRGGTGDWQASNINALVEEALNLAYHGARAQDQDFNVTLERDFASETKPIEVVPQDVTRVFLNLFGNGFYAAKKRQLSANGSDYRPTLTVSTRDLGEAVEIRVRDNGTGIAPEVRAKLFQPFFTTKPTGEGTGLGLSISYDIVTQQHGGSIDVESEPGSFTEFTVRLPRRRRAA